VLGAIALYLLFSGLGRLLLELGLLGGVFGILIALVGLFVWYTGLVGLIGFAFIAFCASANGRRRVPTITADEFRSLWSRRFIAFATLLAAAAMGWSRLAAVAGHPLIEILTLGMLFLLPAALSLMLLNDSLWQALSPVHQLRMVQDLGWPYLGLPLSLAAAAALVALALDWPWPLGALVWGYGVMLAIHICGDTLYRHHERIGLEPVNDRLTRAQQIRREQRLDQNKQLDVAFALARSDSHSALEALRELFDGEDDTLAQRERVLEKVRLWPNKMVGLRLSQELIERHLALGDDSRAFELTLESLAQNPDFRPAGPEATLRIATIAGSNGRPRILTALLADFPQRFHDHPQREAAALTCARVALEKTNETALARQQLQVLETSKTLAHDPRVARLRQALHDI
jgi:hypothetical protein